MNSSTKEETRGWVDGLRLQDYEPADGFEVFSDPCYYDMWAARQIGERDFMRTAHFTTRGEAVAWTHQEGGVA